MTIRKQKPGPKSLAEIATSNVVKLQQPRIRSRFPAPSALNAAERSLFHELVNANGQLKNSDVPFLADLAQAMVKNRKLARKTDPASLKAWEVTARVVLRMSSSLRITAQSTQHFVTAGRAKKNFQSPSYYDQMENEDENN